MRTAVIDPRLIDHLRNHAVWTANVYRVPMITNNLGERVPDSANREVLFSGLNCYFAHDDSDKGELQEVRQTENVFRRAVYRAYLNGYYPSIDTVMEFGGQRYGCEVDIDGRTFHLIGAYSLPVKTFTELVLEEVKTRV